MTIISISVIHTQVGFLFLQNFSIIELCLLKKEINNPKNIRTYYYISLLEILDFTLLVGCFWGSMGFSRRN